MIFFLICCLVWAAPWRSRAEARRWQPCWTDCCSESTVPVRHLLCCCKSMAATSRPRQLLLCLAAAPDLLRCALVVRRVVERWAVSHGRARVVRGARPAGGGPLLRLPVRVVAVGRAVVWVLLGVQPVVSAGAELVQLPVLTVVVVSVHTQRHC